jgi:hypothetical protein
MTEAIFKSRRDFLAGTAAAVTAASMPLPAFASQFRRFGARPLLVVYRPHDAHAAAFADEFNAAGYVTLALSDDPVRQWRDGLGRFVREDNVLLLGLTNWSDYTMLRGLTAEERRFPLFESGQARSTDTADARRLAREVLALADAGDAELALQQISAARTAAPALFSWAL